MFSHNCSLECLNGGTCSSSTDSSTTNAYPMEVCDCPPGFSGVNCNDTSFVLCGPNQRRCLNGATCVHSIDPITKIDQSFCDCSVASIRDRAFAGQFCQHLVTMYCPVETDDDPSSFPQHSFCSNGGRCKRIVQDGEIHQGCECTKEWTGDHCQNPSGVFDTQSLSNFLGFPIQAALIIGFSVIVVLVLYLTVRTIHRERLQLERSRLEARDRCRNLAVGAIYDIDEAFNPYEMDDDHFDIRDIALTLLRGEEA